MGTNPGNCPLARKTPRYFRHSFRLNCPSMEFVFAPERSAAPVNSPMKEESRSEGQLARPLEGMCPLGDQLLLPITDVCSIKGRLALPIPDPKTG